MKQFSTAAILSIAAVFFFSIKPRAAELKLPEGATNSVPEWEEKHRPAILQRMREVMGPMPQHDRKRPLNPQLTEEVDCGEYVRRLFKFESEPNSFVPAYLLIPKSVLQGSGK